MSIIYPPTLPGRLPAQCGGILKFKFQPSALVSKDTNITFRIKTISTEEIIYQETVKPNDNIISSSSISGLDNGQYYKLQIAYNDGNGDILYYSNISIFKYYSGQLSMKKHSGGDYAFQLQMPGYTTQEFITTYRFDYYDNNKVFQFSSEDYINTNNLQIEDNLIIIPWKEESMLLKKKKNKYLIYCRFTTNNGFTEESLAYGEPYLIYDSNQWTQPPTDSIEFTDKSFIKIESNISGKLVRVKNNIEYEILETSASGTSYIDYTVESGIPYSYGIATGTSVTYIGDVYQTTYEDMYLNDDEHMLCIRFNPKVSSFKETVLESKLDTIGSQYPFFFRNGNVKYKEFSIGGLISYNMDNEQLFFQLNSDEEPIRTSTIHSEEAEIFTRGVQLTAENVAYERIFKTKVLEWLNNGKPKVFRSPTEGNFIVRLMNVSLSPEEQLGRMIHSFQATAYEIDEFTIDNIKKHNCLFGGIG